MKKINNLLATLISSAIVTASAMPFCSSAAERIKGDVNGDGIVNNVDSRLILKYYAIFGHDDIDSVKDYSPLTDSDVENIRTYGDLNGDGEIDAVDCARVLFIIMDTNDINGDGNIDINDALYIHDFAVNMDSHNQEEIENLINLTSCELKNEYGIMKSNDEIKESFIDYSRSLAKRTTGFKNGDVNGDGIIDAVDSSLVLRFYSVASNSEDIVNSDSYVYIDFFGDMNNDGIVDTVDASKILRLYAESIANEL